MFKCRFITNHFTWQCKRTHQFWPQLSFKFANPWHYWLNVRLSIQTLRQKTFWLSLTKMTITSWLKSSWLTMVHHLSSETFPSFQWLLLSTCHHKFSITLFMRMREILKKNFMNKWWKITKIHGRLICGHLDVCYCK